MKIKVNSSDRRWAESMAQVAVSKYPERENDIGKFTDEKRSRFDTQMIGFIGEAVFGRTFELAMNEEGSFDRLYDFIWGGHRIDVKTTDRGGRYFQIPSSQFLRSEADIYLRVVLSKDWEEANLMGWAMKEEFSGPMIGKLSPFYWVEEESLKTVEDLVDLLPAKIRVATPHGRKLETEDMM